MNRFTIMRIYSFSRVLGLLFAIPFLAALYYTVEDRSTTSGFLLIFFAACLVAIYVMYGQIDYWWTKKYPIPLDPEILRWMNVYDRFYLSLRTEEERIKYRNRISLYVEAREFISVGSEHHSVPNDLQAVIASQAIQLCFHQKDLLIGDYDRVVLYKHPFPSPAKQFLHTMEVEHEDGVLIFSMEHAIPGIMHRKDHYNIVMQAYAEAFIRVNKKIDWPESSDFDWHSVEKISGFSMFIINETIGYEQKDYLPIMINLYFGFRDKFEELHPEIVRQLDFIFMNKEI